MRMHRFGAGVPVLVLAPALVLTTALIVSPPIGSSQALAGSGADAELRLAGHLAELAALAAPDDVEVQEVRATVFERRKESESSLMARGIFGWAASESRSRLS